MAPFYLVTNGGRTIGSYPSDKTAKESLGQNYPEKVKLLNSEEYEDFQASKDPVGTLSSLGALIN